ncbi:MAG: AAA family ATPase [Actinomycetota bacterium]|nr:AAA family ATPase [Actinomycetota bacterium]
MEIENFRSLEHVRLDGIDRFNVLIGRNNSGKSSVLGALELLGRVLSNRDPGGVGWDRVLSRLDASRSLGVELTFELGPVERSSFFDLLGLGSRFPGGRERIDGSPLLRRVRYLFRSPPGSPDLLHLRETRAIAEDGAWSVVQRMTGFGEAINPSSKYLRFDNVDETFPNSILSSTLLDVDRAVELRGAHMAHEANVQSLPFEPQLPQDAGSSWLRERLVGYFRDAFFFEPFRHSEAILPAQENDRLSQDGANLAQVLHTINSNDRDKFEEIEAFVHGALPDVGRLQPSLAINQTRVDFRSPLGSYRTQLHDMGGGVEQLLMAAVALLTTGDESSLFLEEPEGHLHAGAQRYLIQKLYEGDRQVFVTTHSPTFVNLSRPKSLYRVTLSGGSTEVSKVRGEAELGDVLEDIGARNSDVLLSDAVLFVEGPGDGAALVAWAEELGLGLPERNVVVLPMGGGEHVARGARQRGEVLEGISHNAPVPHVFVVDGDERPSGEVEKLKKDLGDKFHVLQRRELENYLLVPGAIKEAIRAKHPEDDAVAAKVEGTTDDEIRDLIASTADKLYGRVLLNRIRVEVVGLKGGLMTRGIVEKLAPRAEDPDLHEVLKEALQERVAEHLEEVDVEAIVREQREALQREWSIPERQIDLAPGDEILQEVFESLGSTYKKPKDTGRVARHMSEDEVPEEIKDLLNKVARLTERD